MHAVSVVHPIMFVHLSHDVVGQSLAGHTTGSILFLKL